MCSCLPLAGCLVSIVHNEHEWCVLLLQVCAMYTLQTHTGHTTSHDIKASGNGNDIEVVFLAIGGLDSFLCEFLDLVAILLGDVNYLYIITVKHLVVVLFKARTFDAEGMRWLQRAQKISLLWVAYSCSLLLGPEIVYFSVRFCVEEVVFVPTQP